MYFHTFWWSYLWWHRGSVWARFTLTIMIEWHLDCDEFNLLMSCHTKGDMQDFIKGDMRIIIFITSRMRKLVCEQLLLVGMKSLSDTLPPKRNHSQAPFLILDDMLWRKDGIKQICLRHAAWCMHACMADSYFSNLPKFLLHKTSRGWFTPILVKPTQPRY